MLSKCPYCGKQCFLKKTCGALKLEDQWAEEGGKRGPTEDINGWTEGGPGNEPDEKKKN